MKKQAKKPAARAIKVVGGQLLSYEQLLASEREKTQLLKISEAIAAIHDYKQLLRVIYTAVQPIFPFENTGLFVQDTAAKSIIEITDSEILDRSISGRFTDAKMFGPFMLKDFRPKSWYHSPVPMLTTLKREVNYIDDPICKEQFDIGMEAGLKETICGPLITGGRKIGAIYMNTRQVGLYSAKGLGLFKSMTDLLAVAVANIVANEEVRRKANEIERLNKQLTAQKDYLVEEVEQQYNFEEMIGRNPTFVKVCKDIGLVAKTDSAVLVLGETGTGKELVARAIHNGSARHKHPLVRLNCAALPANLIESELFGHERGAFTGAIERRIGKFELAEGSTLFLDEVGELPFELQSKLLRALQEKEIERVGGNKVIPINVRIVAATNRELLKEVQSGRFRQDLYYRLHIFPISLPPLRERSEDIPLLASYFLQKFARRIGKRIKGFGPKAMDSMLDYPWPGNIRELEHVVERAVILASSDTIDRLDLPAEKQGEIRPSAGSVIKSWEDHERDYILEILRITKGNVSGAGGAAELLQLPRSTLQSKMDRLGIKRRHYSDEGN